MLVSTTKRVKTARTNRLRILVCLTLRRSAGVLAIVGELVGEAVGSNGIGVDDRRATTSDHGPDAALGIEDGELKRRARRSIELLDVCLLLREVTAKRRRPDLR